MNEAILAGIVAGLQGGNMPKQEKREIEYAPAPKHLVESIRKELRRLVETKDLDQHLGEIGRFAIQADDMLMCVKSPEAVMKSEHAVTVPGAPATPFAAGPESYGATLVRQLMGALVQYQQAQKESPESLAFALVTARRAGMTDVAAELEKKLLGKSLDGDRPVDGRMHLTDEVLKSLGAEPIPGTGARRLPPVTILPPVAPKKQSKKNGARAS